MNETLTARIGRFAVVAVISLAGVLALSCSGGPKKPSFPMVRQRAVELNNRANLAYEKGEYERARNLYGEALRAARSIEHSDGMAINLLSLTAVDRKLGNPEEALQHLDEMLEPTGVVYPAAMLFRAAELKAMVLMDGGDLEGSVKWSDSALSYCAASACSGEGRLYNLKARIRLLGGDDAGAQAEARKALGMNRKTGDLREEANSVRLMADAMLAEERHSEARSLYEQALSIDKRLGLGPKIAADLIGVGRALLGMGSDQEALVYFNRALSVSRAAHDTGRQEEASGMIEEIMKKH